MQVFVDADGDGGEAVVAAGKREAAVGVGGVGAGKVRENLLRGELDGLLNAGELARNGDRVKGFTRGGEVGVGREAGTGAVCLPLVAEQAGVGEDVAVGSGVGGAGRIGAVLRVTAVVVFGLEAVEDEAWVRRAFRGAGVGEAELG